MLRIVSASAAVLLAGWATVANAVAGETKTIRIEPHTYYGANVSHEAGVRVIRPVPRTTHVIVNPNKTPLKLTFTDVKKRTVNNINNYGTVDRGFRRFGTFGIGSRKFKRFRSGGARGQRVGGSSGLRLSR